MLPTLPSFDLDTTLKEIHRVLSFILPQAELQAYEESISKLITPPDAPLRASIQGAAELLPTNPACSFRSFLLSPRGPLFQTLTIPSVLCTPPGDQVTIAARLLSRLAVIASAPDEYLSVSPSGSPLDTGETSLFLGTTRRVGSEADTLLSTPSSHHVVVWRRGRAFSLNVLDGLHFPQSEGTITTALKKILDLTEGCPSVETTIASLSWNLSRSDWFEARQVLEVDAANALSFVSIDTALATIASESFSLSSDPAQQIEEVRTGRGSVNRYADQVVGLVVYEDGAAGLTVDHAPVDGGIAAEFANQLVSTDRPKVHSHGSITPMPLEFSLPLSVATFPLARISLDRTIRVVELGQLVPTEVITLAYQYRLVPFMIHMAIQSALRGLKSPTPLVVQPTSMRHFTHGRSEPSYPTTSASIALTSALNDVQDQSNGYDVTSDPKLASLFFAAHIAYKAVVKTVKGGTGVGRYMMFLHSIAAQAEIAHQSDADLQRLIRAWARFCGMVGPIVFVTGFDQSPGVQNGLGNLYINNQLACWYSGCSGDVRGLGESEDTMAQAPRISLALGGTGVFFDDEILDHMVDRISTTFALLARIGINMHRQGGNLGGS